MALLLQLGVQVAFLLGAPTGLEPLLRTLHLLGFPPARSLRGAALVSGCAGASAALHCTALMSCLS